MSSIMNELNIVEIVLFFILGSFFGVIVVHLYQRKKKPEIQLDSKIKQVQKLASIGEMSAEIVHDLKNPLGFLINNHFLIKKYFNKLSKNEDDPALEKIAHLIRVNEKGLEDIKQIIQGFLSFSRTMEDKKEEILSLLVQDIYQLIHTKFVNDGIEIQMDLDENIRFKCYQTQIKQVILNLVNNAKHAMKGNENPKLHISLSLKDHFITLVIKDNGKGIAKEHLQDIFQPFYTTKPEQEGSGLGLSICKKIIEEHGGTIRVESELGIGTSFIIQFLKKS